MATKPNVSVVVRRDEPIERALRRFKRLCESAGIRKLVRAKERYEKPSEARRPIVRSGPGDVARHLRGGTCSRRMREVRDVVAARPSPHAEMVGQERVGRLVGRQVRGHVADAHGGTAPVYRPTAAVGWMNAAGSFGWSNVAASTWRCQ